jgi:DNA polymerase zeta
LLFHIQGGNGLSSLRHWDDDSSAYTNRNEKKLYSELVATGITGWEYAGYPPSLRETKRWLKQDANIVEKRKNQAASSQVNPPIKLSKCISRKTDRRSNPSEYIWFENNPNCTVRQKH